MLSSRGEYGSCVGMKNDSTLLKPDGAPILNGTVEFLCSDTPVRKDAFDARSLVLSIAHEGK